MPKHLDTALVIILILSSGALAHHYFESRRQRLRLVVTGEQRPPLMIENLHAHGEPVLHRLALQPHAWNISLSGKVRNSTSVMLDLSSIPARIQLEAGPERHATEDLVLPLTLLTQTRWLAPGQWTSFQIPLIQLDGPSAGGLTGLRVRIEAKSMPKRIRQLRPR